jgi:hypothetical protein
VLPAVLVPLAVRMVAAVQTLALALLVSHALLQPLQCGTVLVATKLPPPRRPDKSGSGTQCVTLMLLEGGANGTAGFAWFCFWGSAVL